MELVRIEPIAGKRQGKFEDETPKEKDSLDSAIPTTEENSEKSTPSTITH
ncbi:MAG: hypothetical protein ACI8VC_002236 [Candidatus Endobugula sp.]|jgi:hypothetical protein